MEEYSHDLEKNLEALEMEVQALNEMRNDLLKRVLKEKGRGLQVLLEVREWVSMVEEIEAKAIPLLDKSISQLQKLSKYDDISHISASTHQYSEAVGMTLKEVETHKSKGVFKELVERAPLSHFKKMLPLQKIASREMLLEKAWKRLAENECRTLALYGMAGVGKTTLLTQIKNKFIEVGYVPSLVIFVVVKSEKVESIQDEIGERLGVNLGEEEKASDIFKFLYRKRFVLLLDGIQRTVDLEEIGIPQPSKENGCKIVFTTRSQEACGSKWVDAVEEVECLNPKESWDFFQKTVGETTLKIHPDIPQLARIVARKCGGLPIALNLIGKIMSSKMTIREWRRAIHVLVSSTDREVPILKLTYDNLPGDNLKLCFLYCALFSRNSDISKQDLVDCWIGEGIIAEKEDREIAETEGYEMIGDLVRIGLLMENESGYGVKMHDMVLEMALWIASQASDSGQGAEENFVVKWGERIHRMPRVSDWNKIRRMSVTSTKIETISDSPPCSELRTLFLQENANLKQISGDFFRWMTSLAVLNLSCNRELSELPEEVSSLVSLQFLNLSWTWINRLPLGLKELKKLIHLDLDHTSNLKEIEVIASLLNLQVLRLFCSVPMDLSLMESLQVVKGLKELSLTVVEDSVFARLLSSDRLTSCIRRICLRDLTITDGVIALLKAMFSLRELDIFGCNIPGTTIDWRSNIQMKSVHSGNVEMIPQFRNMRTVSLHECNGLRDLTWLIAAPSLDNLTLYKCPEIEQIISKEKYMAELGHTSEKPFQSLSRLSLNDLPKLESIYWTPLPFPVLEDIIISGCPELRRLPFNSESAKGNQLRLDLNEEWIKGVQWEDKATEKRFSGFSDRDFSMMAEEQKIDGLESYPIQNKVLVENTESGKKVLQSETNITGVTMEHTHVYRISTPEVLKSHMIDDGGPSAVEKWTKGVEREDEATNPDKNWTNEATEQHSSGFRSPKMAEEESVDGLASELHPNKNKVLVGTTQSGEIATASSSSGNKVLQPETHTTGLSWKFLSRDGSKGSPTTSFTYMPRTEGEILQNANLKVFTLSELKSATRNFRPDGMVGEGAFGRVFKGWIDETTFAPSKPGTGIVIAVKRLNKEGGVQGQSEWLAEINYLGQLDHPNIVKLIGYCSEEEHRLLVYEFMPCGSLDNHLFKKGTFFQPLSWNSRIRVALDAARGLAFLHNAQPQVIYRDFNASNILLDSNYNAKLSDFGLARDGPMGNQSHVTTRIMGTYGYAAPEYMATGHLTSKSDVYSFGVVLLELLSGRRAIERNQRVGEDNLVEWAKPYLKNKRRLLRVMDPRLQGQYSLTRALKVAILALECINIDFKIRPTMNDIVKTLEELGVHMEAPKEQQNLQPDNSENNTEITNIVETKVCCEGCFGR